MEQVQKEFEWFIEPLKNHYFDFEGRVTRQAFWMFTLWSIIIYIGLSIIAEPAAMLFSLATLLPSLGLGARRLHDIGMSGWWQLIWFIPILGWIAIIVLLAKQGIAGANEYGADPRVSTGVLTGVPSAPVAPAPQVTAAPAAPTDSEVR